MSHQNVIRKLPSEKEVSRGNAQQSIADVVEAIGFGKAQLFVLFTGGAVLFNRGVHMCLMAVLTLPIAAQLKLSQNQEGLLSTAMFGGMFAGTIASGYVGDRIGRRFPVCASSITVVLLGCASALSGSFTVLLLMRFLLGFAMAFGDVPVTALFSEVSPQRWRIPMRAFAEAFFDVGYTYAAALASFHDPFLRNLAWKKLVIFASIPPGAMGLLAAVFMPESPVYLASCGQHEEANRIFGIFQRLNGATSASIEYSAPQSPAAGVKKQTSNNSTNTLALVLGPRYYRTTLTLAYIAFVLNIFYYGGMYAQPQVMTKGKGLAPGWEIVVGGPFDMVGIIVATIIAQSVPRKIALSASLAFAAIGISAFGFAGSIQERSAFLEIVYQFGVFSFYWVPAMAFIVFGQLAVESFPTLAATTGGSIAFCTGRLGAMAAPLIFENVRAITGRWNLFCYLSAAFSVLAVFMLAAESSASEPTKEDPYEPAPDRRIPLADAEAGKES